jgi:acyl carrier protein
VLDQFPALHKAVVVVREEVEGDKRLVAYVVPKQEPAPTTSDLRTFLKAQLPDYMIPAAFVYLNSMPLTPNGKVDRKALPLPDLSRPELEESFVIPRTPVEEMLADIWAEVLKLDRVGIHDNFFDLGGHSLLATLLISRINKKLQLDVPLRSLFDAPTIAGLVTSIDASLGTEKDREQASRYATLGDREEIEL